MNTATRIYYIQTSTDGGKTFDTVKRAIGRPAAFRVFTEVSKTNRTRMFHGHDLLIATHREDVQAEIDKRAVKA